MKKILVVLMILVFSLSAFAKDEAKKPVEKPDLKTLRKIQYYKIVATEEKNILEKFIKCLDGAKNKEMMDMCSRARQQQMAKLRKTATPKPQPAKVNPHKPVEKKMIRQESMDVMSEGFNCAETVMIMAGRYYLPDINICYSRLVTGFGAGIGRTKQEACGALTGCITALSILIGRDTPDVNVYPIHERMSEVRDVFIERFGTTKCDELREGKEGDELKERCQNLTADMVVLFFEYLDSIGIAKKV